MKKRQFSKNQKLNDLNARLILAEIGKHPNGMRYSDIQRFIVDSGISKLSGFPDYPDHVRKLKNVWTNKLTNAPNRLFGFEKQGILDAWCIKNDGPDWYKTNADGYLEPVHGCWQLIGMPKPNEFAFPYWDKDKNKKYYSYRKNLEWTHGFYTMEQITSGMGLAFHEEEFK